MLRRQVVAWLADSLVPQGFRRRGDVFTKQWTPEILGRVGLAMTFYRRDQLLAVTPTIGVRHEKLERNAAVLYCVPDRAVGPRTVLEHLGYLMPQRSDVVWEFAVGEVTPEVRERVAAMPGGTRFMSIGSSNAETAGMMATAIREYALPFIERMASLESIAEWLEQPGAPALVRRSRLPMAYRMLGRGHDAEAILRRALADVGDDSPASNRFRVFAYRFLGDDRAAVAVARRQLDLLGEQQGAFQDGIRSWCRAVVGEDA